jgi:hypothetical protein
MRHVTHLSIFGGSEYFPKQWSWTGFNSLQHLTHFAFDLYTSLSPEVVYHLIPQFPKSLQVCLVLLSAREGKMPLGEYLKRHKEAKQMVVGDMDKRIVVGVAEDVSEEINLSEWQGLLVVRRWDDHFGSYEPLQRAEHVVKTRLINSWCALLLIIYSRLHAHMISKSDDCVLNSNTFTISLQVCIIASKMFPMDIQNMTYCTPIQKLLSRKLLPVL